MTSGSDISSNTDDDLLAAEFVLGVLELEERFAVQGRIHRDRTFAALVDDWNHRLEGLNEQYELVSPPNLLPKIEQQLFRTARKRRVWSYFAWPTALIGAVATVLLVAAIFLSAPPQATLIALTSEGSSTQFEGRLTSETLTVVKISGEEIESGTSFELWFIEPGGSPKSLGLITDFGLTVAAPVSDAEVTLAVSVEPSGGSPTGSPTGPVVAAATLKLP